MKIKLSLLESKSKKMNHDKTINEKSSKSLQKYYSFPILILIFFSNYNLKSRAHEIESQSGNVFNRNLIMLLNNVVFKYGQKMNNYFEWKHKSCEVFNII